MAQHQAARKGFEKPAFFVGPDRMFHFLGHNHGSCAEEGHNQYHHLYHSLGSASESWQCGGHWGNGAPQHPFYEPVPVPRDGTGAFGDRVETGVPEFFVDFGQLGTWHSNITLMRVEWVAVGWKTDDRPSDRGNQVHSVVLSNTALPRDQHGDPLFTGEAHVLEYDRGYYA